MTPGDLRVLDAIKAYVQVHRVVPTFKELSEILGLRSRSNISVRMERLKNAGHIEPIQSRARSGARAYRLTDEAFPARRLSTEELVEELRRRGALS